MMQDGLCDLEAMVCICKRRWWDNALEAWLKWSRVAVGLWEVPRSSPNGVLSTTKNEERLEIKR